MKTMKRTLIDMVISTGAAFAAQPGIKIVATAKPNGIADANSLQGTPLKYVTIATTGCNLVTNIETALQFQFVDSVTGSPVNVQNLTFSVARYSLYRNNVAVTSWIYQPHGAWNPPGDTSFPDLLAYNAAGSQVSTNGTQVVGTNLTSVSKIQILRQSIPLGSASRPLMTGLGNKYGLERFWTFSYTYEGVTYTDQSLPLAETYVEVNVVQDIQSNPNVPGPLDDSPGPFVIEFQVSEDLSTWYSVPFLELNTSATYPVTFNEFKAWYPLNQDFHGSLHLDYRRFYRLVKTNP